MAASAPTPEDTADLKKQIADLKSEVAASGKDLAAARAKIRDLEGAAIENGRLVGEQEAQNRDLAEKVKSLEGKAEEEGEAPFPLDLVPQEPDNPLNLVHASESVPMEHGDFGYHRAVSCAQDAGYQIDALRTRALGAVNAAFALERLGQVRQTGEPEWRGFPPFDPSRSLHVAVWME